MTALVVKVTEVVGRYSDAGDAEGIADDDGEHVNLWQLLPDEAHCPLPRPRGRYRIVVEFTPDP